MIDTSRFVFPSAKDVVDGDVTAQDLHDLCIVLGASCQHCTTVKPRRRKAFDRAAERADVLARAKLRRLALLHDVDVAVAEAETPL